MRHTGLVPCALILAGGLLLSGDLDAGSLEPPGPPAPTMKSLQQVEARTPITSLPTSIITPGSYYLTGNLTGISGYDGINIMSSGVTLDLNGFTLSGVAGSYSGIYLASSAYKQAVIRNGTLRGWGRRGIDAFYSPDVHVEDVLVDGNGTGGIAVGPRGVVRDSSATANTGIGIYAAAGSTIDGCTSGSNTQTGFTAAGSVTLSRSTAVSNGTSGFVLDQASKATDCTAQSNVTGFVLYAGSRVDHSTARQNSVGIQAAGYGVAIEQCTAEYNTSDGILVGSQALVRGNLVHDNTTNGIHVTTAGSQIVDNAAISNATGIRVDATTNVIVKNYTSYDTTPYSIAAGNKVGTISADPATAGPWANF